MCDEIFIWIFFFAFLPTDMSQEQPEADIDLGQEHPAEKLWGNYVDEALDEMAPELRDRRQLFIWSALRAMDALTTATARRWLADKRSFRRETPGPDLSERLRDMYLSPDAKSVDDIIGSTMAYGAVTAGFSFPETAVENLSSAVQDSISSSSSSGQAAAAAAEDRRIQPHHAGQLIAAAALAAADLSAPSAAPAQFTAASGGAGAGSDSDSDSGGDSEG